MARRLQTYSRDEITVTVDPSRRAHVGECLRRLPAVFDVRRARWIRVESATPEDVARTVERCPSGALQYAMPNAPAETADSDPSIRTTRDGPIQVRGPITLVTEDGAPITTLARRAYPNGESGNTTNGARPDSAPSRCNMANPTPAAPCISPV